MKDSPDIHRTLARQLRRLGIRDLERPPPPEAWRDLLAVISRTYASAEEDRYLLERSLVDAGHRLRGTTSDSQL